jgi:ubiquinone/menaquinone biosynthesis C-methylase UbiE/PAS domain-containing protein
LLVLSLGVIAAGKEDGLWFAPIGIGLVLIAWLGSWMVPLLFADFLLVRLLPGRQGHPLADSAIFALQAGVSWWCYAYIARERRRLDHPRSAITFLILVPGALAGIFACGQTLVWKELGIDKDFWTTALAVWRSHALGIMILAPALLALLTPVWVDLGWTWKEAPEAGAVPATRLDWTWGERIEIAGLALTAGVLGVLLALLQVRERTTSWPFWGLSLLVVVWAALRQDLRGGAAAAGLAGLLALVTASPAESTLEQLLPLQGNLLSQCCVALLVGGSVGWIRASELRYRQIVGHIPVVLYSVRVPRWVPGRLPGVNPSRQNRQELSAGAALVQFAEVTLVSPACKDILGCEPQELLGPLRAWLERILPSDREIVVASLTQLCLQKRPVTCEYRLTGATVGDPATAHDSAIGRSVLPILGPRPNQRWLRDTLAPHYGPDGHLDGWEGVVEDVTEQRILAHDLRHVSALLHALVIHLPTGIYFVQAPLGQPVLVNNRARQLLGQREDLAAGLSHLSRVYRLRRPDGSEYPWEELPVAKALRDGSTCMAEDIVVHRADGRHIRLISWAAPVDLGGQGRPNAAVWVLEDLSPFKPSKPPSRKAPVDNAQNIPEHRRLIVNQFTKQALPFSQMRDHSPELILTAAEVGPTDIVLDVACGPGMLACAFAEIARHVTGIDLTPAMIERAQALQESKGRTNMTWRIGDVLPLPFPDASFSLIFTRYSFHHFPDPRAVLAEMVRVCQPGGRVVVVDVFTTGPEQAREFNRMEKLRDPSHVRALSLEELTGLLDHVGLQSIKTQFYKHGFRLEQVLEGSFPNPGDAERVRQLFVEDLGVDRLGLGASREEGDIQFAYPIVILAGRQR